MTMKKSRFYVSTCLAVASGIASTLNLAKSKITLCRANAGVVRQMVTAAALLTGVFIPIHTVAADYTRIDAVTATQPPVHTHDLAVVSIKPPKKVTLSAAKPTVVTTVKVAIQNRSPYTETIQDLSTLAKLVNLSVDPETTESNCAAPVPVLHAGKPQPVLPVTLKPTKTLKLVFDVTYTCAVDPIKAYGHEYFHYIAQIDASALDGQEDVSPASDVCPREPLPAGTEPFPDVSIPDRGCGHGAAVLTDIMMIGGSGGNNTDKWGEWLNVSVEYNAVTTEDLNGDGAIDILLAGLRRRLRYRSSCPDSHCKSQIGLQYFARLYLQDALKPGTFLAAEEYPLLGRADAVDTGDLDQDGIPDFAVLQRELPKRYWGKYKNVNLEIFSQYMSGAGGFLSQEDYKTSKWHSQMAVGDLNADGLPDIAIGGSELALMINSPKSPGRSFSLRSLNDAPYIISSIAVADINNDGRNDLAVTSDQSVIVYLQDSPPAMPGNYTISGTYDAGAIAVDVAVADLNNDSLPDLVVATSDDYDVGVGIVSVRIQDPLNTGQFLPANFYQAVKSINAVAIGDLNNDLLPDIAISHGLSYSPNAVAGGISILFQDQQIPGEFPSGVTYPSKTLASDVALDDLNGDDLIDLVSFNSSGYFGFGEIDAVLYIRFQDINNPGAFSDPVVLP
jgi:FG-GAP-like repeat